MTDELLVARVKRTTDNTQVSPLDLLKSIVHDIEVGKIEIDGVIVLTALRPENDSWIFDTFRAGMTRMDELSTIVLAQERTIRHWLEA